MNDIQNIEDIKIIINFFYEKIRKDDLLAPVFATRIDDENWQKHLDIMYRFWFTVLFGEIAYQGNPFSKHVTLPITKFHFEQWISLFHQTIDENFKGEIAENAKEKSIKISEMFQFKLNKARENGLHQII